MLQSFRDFLAGPQSFGDLVGLTLLAGAILGASIPTKSKRIFWIGLVAATMAFVPVIAAIIVANGDEYGIVWRFIFGLAFWTILALIAGMLSMIITGTIGDWYKERKRAE